jgi:L-amino acid N-acyltransferase YncA
MSSPIKVQRVTDRDLPLVEPAYADAVSQRGSLLAHRRERCAPSTWMGSRAPSAIFVDGGVVRGFSVALADPPLAVARCAEAIVHVHPAFRRQGVGRALFAELITMARAAGLWKLVAWTIPDDVAALVLLARLDFREVGVLAKHLQIEGGWRDVALHERLVLAARKSAPSFSNE